MMNESYRILFGTGLALLLGAVDAQTGGDTNYPSPDEAPQSTEVQSPEQSAPTSTDSASPTDRLPATKDMAAPESSPGTTEKMYGQSSARAQASVVTGTQLHAQKYAKHAHHAAKLGSRPAQVAARGETTYRQALRHCVAEQDQDQRDSCLDNAIEQFQRNG